MEYVRVRSDGIDAIRRAETRWGRGSVDSGMLAVCKLSRLDAARNRRCDTEVSLPRRDRYGSPPRRHCYRFAHKLVFHLLAREFENGSKVRGRTDQLPADC